MIETVASILDDILEIHETIFINSIMRNRIPKMCQMVELRSGTENKP